MAGSSAIEAGRAFVRLFLKDDLSQALAKSVESSGKTVTSFGHSLTSIGSKAFGGAFDAIGELGGGVFGKLAKFAASPAGMFTGFITAGVAAGRGGEEIARFTLKTGIAAEQLGTLKYAADVTGIGLDGLATVFARMSKTQFSKESLPHLAKLVGDLQAYEAMRPDEKLRAVAAGLAKIPDPAKRAAKAMEVFGRGGADILPLVLELDKLEARARELGFDQMTTESVQTRKEFSRLIGDVELLGKAIMSTIGTATIGVVKGYMGILVNAVKGVRDWIKENKAIVQNAFSVSAAIVGAGTAFMVAGIAIAKVGALITMAGTAIGVLLNPLVLLGATLAGLAVYWVRFTERGQAAWRSLVAAVLPIVDTLKTTFGGIVDALKVGEWETAARIGMLGVKAAFLDALEGLASVVPESLQPITDALLTIGELMVSGEWSQLGTTIWEGLKAAWDWGTNEIKANWDNWIQELSDVVYRTLGDLWTWWNQKVTDILEKMGLIEQKSQKQLNNESIAAAEQKVVDLENELALMKEGGFRQTREDLKTGEVHTVTVEEKQAELDKARRALMWRRGTGMGGVPNAPAEKAKTEKRGPAANTAVADREAARKRQQDAADAARARLAGLFGQGESVEDRAAREMERDARRKALKDEIEALRRGVRLPNIDAADEEEFKALTEFGSDAKPGLPSAISPNSGAVTLGPTFSASAAAITGQLGTGGPQERIVEAAREQVEEARKTRVAVEENTNQTKQLVTANERFFSSLVH